MQKQQELDDPESCLNRAHADEAMFVLLARDAAASATVRFWIDERIRLGKNNRHDMQIHSAENLADLMDAQFELRRKALDNR